MCIPTRHPPLHTTAPTSAYPQAFPEAFASWEIPPHRGHPVDHLLHPVESQREVSPFLMCGTICRLRAVLSAGSTTGCTPREGKPMAPGTVSILDQLDQASQPTLACRF